MINTITHLPTGTLTFLFTDVEGSTKLWESYPNEMKALMARHDEMIEAIVESHNGQVVRPRGEGDSRFAVFQRASDAVLAASNIQSSFYQKVWNIPDAVRVRVAIHTGEAELREGDYYGSAVNRCARLRNLANGGQTLLTQVSFGLVNENLPPNIRLRDLGEYKLKDLKSPERIYQLVTAGLPSDFPPLRSVQHSIKNMPVSLTSFVGREREIKEIKQLLDNKRLLTISGPGGAGKTRLALQVATESLEQFPSGVWFVDLSPLSDPGLVPQYIMIALGIQEEACCTQVETLSYFFQDKSALLLLDNCEHLLQGVTQLVQTLIRETSGLKILSTSREPLGVSGETVWCIPSLSTPKADEDLSIEKLMQYEAVRLFIERSKAVKPNFAITHENANSIAQICSRLEGIPLAIELAAARTKVLSASDIASRLDNRLQFLVSYQNSVPRQKTLRNLIDWSHETLPQNERILFRRLSVFSGGWTLQAAEQVCSGESFEPFEVLDLLAHLVDKSLVIPEISDGTERYRYLETIRQYARERLVESEETEVYSRKHAEYFTKMVELSYGETWGKNQGYWLQWLDAELDNLRSALKWLAQNSDASEMYLRMAGSLWRFWRIRGYISEGRDYLEDALKKNNKSSPYLRANGLRGASKLALQQCDYGQALTMAQESLELFKHIGDQLGVARQLDVLGEVTYYQGDYTQAIKLHKDSLTIKYAINDKEGIAVSLRQLGAIARDRGEHTRAKDLYEDSLTLFRELEDKIFIAQTLNNLGVVEHSLCEYQRANSLFEEAVSIYRDLQDKVGISNTLQNLGNVSKDQGELKRAKSYYDECLRLKQELGDKRGIAQAQTTLAEVAFYQGKYNITSELAENSLKLFQALGVKRGILFSMGLLAYAAQYRGDLERATYLADQCMKIAKEINAPRPVAYCKEVLGLVEYARNNLPEARVLLHEAIGIFKKVGDRRNVASALVNLARTAYRQGEFENASNFIDESLVISRKLDAQWTTGLALEILGLLQRSQGNHERALELFHNSLKISVNQDNQQGIVNCLGAIAGLAILANRPAEAMSLFAASQKIRKENGVKMGMGDLAEYNEYLTLVRQQLDDKKIKRAWERGYSITIDQAIEGAYRISFSYLSKQPVNAIT